MTSIDEDIFMKKNALFYSTDKQKALRLDCIYNMKYSSRKIGFKHLFIF